MNITKTAELSSRILEQIRDLKPTDTEVIASFAAVMSGVFRRIDRGTAFQIWTAFQIVVNRIFDSQDGIN